MITHAHDMCSLIITEDHPNLAGIFFPQFSGIEQDKLGLSTFQVMLLGSGPAFLQFCMLTPGTPSKCSPPRNEASSPDSIRTPLSVSMAQSSVTRSFRPSVSECQALPCRPVWRQLLPAQSWCHCRSCGDGTEDAHTNN